MCPGSLSSDISSIHLPTFGIYISGGSNGMQHVSHFASPLLNLSCLFLTVGGNCIYVSCSPLRLVSTLSGILARASLRPSMHGQTASLQGDLRRGSGSVLVVKGLGRWLWMVCGFQLCLWVLSNRSLRILGCV